MERMERVKRYIEILAQYDEGNTFYNWSILDTLSDDDLYNKERIAEKINIIQKHQERIENNHNKYSEEVMECVRQRWGWDGLMIQETKKSINYLLMKFLIMYVIGMDYWDMQLQLKRGLEIFIK